MVNILTVNKIANNHPLLSILTLQKVDGHELLLWRAINKKKGELLEKSCDGIDLQVLDTVQCTKRKDSRHTSKIIYYRIAAHGFDLIFMR